MRKFLILLAALALLRLEHTGTEISQLEPVALVQITASSGTVTIRTDTGARGEGGSLSEAVADLNDSTPSRVFLDTAEYLIINKEGTVFLPELWDLLRPACRVCCAGGRLDPEEARDYLSVHPPQATILQYRAGSAELQTLTIRDGRGHLAGE